MAADAQDDGADIVSIETYALAVPLARPIADASATMTHWTVPVVEITTRDGRVGTGVSGVHAASEILCNVITDYFAPALLDTSSVDIDGIWNRLYWLPTHWIGRAGAVHMAQAMVDIALWDLAAQRVEQPLWRVLGGTPEPIQAYNTDGGWLNSSEDELVRDLSSLLDAGWRHVKIKMGKADWREDARRARVVRDAIGDDVTLMCDTNQRWDLATAMAIMPALEDVRMDWVEEPLHADDLEAHIALQRSTTLDIAAGESLYSVQQFTSFLTHDAIRVVQPDVTRLGGVTEWRQVAALAASRNLRLAAHAGDMMQVHQHLAGTEGSSLPPLIEFIPWTQDAFVERSIVRDGFLHRPQAPGASTAITPAARQAWQVPGVGATRRTG